MKKLVTLISLSLMAGTFWLSAQPIPGVDNIWGRGRTYVAPNITGQTVTIDGKADEAFWSGVPWEKLNFVLGGNKNTTPGVSYPDSLDFYHRIKIAWDANNLYIFNEAFDNVVIAEQGGNHLSGDHIEFMFGMDSLWYDGAARPLNTSTDKQRDPNNAARNFVQSQLRFNVGSTSITGGGVAVNEALVTDHSKAPLTAVELSTVTTTNGWTGEYKIPWAVLYNPNPAVIKTFVIPAQEGGRLSFETQAADVEITGGVAADRTWVMNWNAISDQAWREVRAHGWLHLGPEVAVNVELAKATSFRLFPSMVTSDLTVELIKVQDVKAITIVNVTGQRMMRATSLETVNVFQLSHLPAGIYMLNVENTNGSALTQKFVKK